MSSHYPVAFAQAQIAPWRTSASPVDLEKRLRSEMRRYPNVFLLEILGEDVVVHQSEQIDQLVAQGLQPEVVRRINLFRRLILDAIAEKPMMRRIVIAIDTGDLAESRNDLPLFSFQRRKGDKTLLFPDFEIISLDYLENDIDALSYCSKADQAFFSGSTTGKASITHEDVMRGDPPRLRAARYFRNTDLVRFELPKIVQCASQDVEEALRREGLGRGSTQLFESHAYKFGISIDGNGAPCSRPAIILKSQSALLKYDSFYELFYSRSLIPWLHYIPISTDSEVVGVMQTELDNPGIFQYIANSGEKLFDEILGKQSALTYTRLLLEYYLDVFYSNL